MRSAASRVSTTGTTAARRAPRRRRRYTPPVPEPVRFPARDGLRLAGDLFLPAGPPRAAALVAPAMGVARGYYGPFASFLAREGVAALTFDYRGIGGSRDGGRGATLGDWGERDLPGALDLLALRFPGVPLLWVGHSVGGQLLGVADEGRVAAAVLVGAQSGDWRLWPGAGRWKLLALWYAVIPLVVPLLGRLPAAVLGGEDVPGGVAREWAEWGRARDYVLSHARPRGGLGFTRLTAPLLSYAFPDDDLAPLPAVEALLGYYSAARGELRVVRPAEIGARAIGHFGFFRERFEETLWRDAAGWLARAARLSAGDRAGAPSPSGLGP
jgi:predicted alpha/beta hydrolase